MKRFLLAMTLFVTMMLQSNAAIYVIGNDPFGNWDPSVGIEMTADEEGLYSTTFTCPDGTTSIWFVLADGLGTSSSDWDNFNTNYRYGPTTGSDETVTVWESEDDPNFATTTTQKQGNGNGAYKITNLVAGNKYTIYFSLDLLQFWVVGATEAPTGRVFSVTGDNAALFGDTWNPANTDNDMTLNEETGLYEFKKENVALTAGELKFKVCVNHGWDESYPGNAATYCIVDGDGNYVATIEEDANYDVVITYIDDDTHVVTFTATKTSGVEEVNTVKDVANVRYIDMMGRVSNAQFAGMNIVVTTYTDGTTSTVKVIR